MQRHTDTLLLEQAYKATQLKEHFPNMSLGQVRLVIENASPTELEMHTDVHHHLHPLLEATARAPSGSASTDGIEIGARLAA